jgi:phosphate transport system permease protein
VSAWALGGRARAARRGRRGRPRRSLDAAAYVFFFASAAFVLVATVAVLAFLARAGLRGFRAAGLWAPLFGTTWRPETSSYGGLPLVAGTLASASIAVALGAVPAVLSAIWAAELAPPGPRAASRRLMELASAVPSVAYGWLALEHVVPLVGRLAGALRGRPAGGGEGLASAGALLAVMIAPTVHLLAREAVAKVPREVREASAALGASPLQTAFRAVAPACARGLAVATFFGFARAAGETMAVQMVIGGARRLPRGPFEPTTTVAAQIVMDMQNARPGTPASDVLFSMALVLLAVSVGAVLLTRWLEARGGE